MYPLDSVRCYFKKNKLGALYTKGKDFINKFAHWLFFISEKGRAHFISVLNKKMESVMP